MKPITERQQKYLVSMLSREFKSNRKIILNHLYRKSSTTELSLIEASDLIEILAPDNRDEKKVQEWHSLINEAIGQTKLF